MTAGPRDRHRRLLDDTIARGNQELSQTSDSAQVAAIRRTLLEAHAARAEEARYGAGQLSRGAQRAPTLEDCEDGWRRVAEIVENARASAEEAQRQASALEDARSAELARRAQAAAQAAATIVAARNRAYTFQTLPSLSFGEGWYLAAAAVLRGVSIQIKPGTPHEVQAHRFVEDAGLEHLLVPYRPRPASPKHLTAMIAQAFAEDPRSAQRALRQAFLGADPPASTLVSWLDRHMLQFSESKKVLLWVRTSTHGAHRNTDFTELTHVSRSAREAGLTPIFFGDALPPSWRTGEAERGQKGVDLTLCWKEPLFQGPDMRRAQLQLFELLRQRHGLVGQVGVTTAGMDGPALLGLPTAYLTAEPNVRLGRWVGAVPGYQQVVRAAGYLDALGARLREWSRDAGPSFAGRVRAPR